MRWRWLVGAGVALLIFLLIRSVGKPSQPKLHEIRWQADAPITYILPCDLDGDGRDQVVVETKNGEYWWLKPSLNGWKATLIPVKGIRFIHYHYAASLHHGILARDANNALCFLHYRNGWRWQKLLDAPMQDFGWLDLDGDGKVNDVLVLKRGWVWWFKIGDDGRVVVQDRQRAPEWLSSLLGVEFWSEKGKLVVSYCWRRWEVPKLDWDGDGVPEIVHYNTSSSDDKLIVHFSRTGGKRQIYLINSPIEDPDKFELGLVVAANLEGKGKRELATIAKTERIILIDEHGQWRPTPCKPFYARRLWITRRGEKDWLWVATPKKLYLLHHNEKGYQVRQWEFEGDPLAVWQDKQGVWFAFCSQWSLNSHPFGRWVIKVSNRLRSLGIPLDTSILTQQKIWLHLWKWDESRNDWQRVKRNRIPTRLGYPLLLYVGMFKLVDLNGDGQNEWIVKVGTLSSLSSLSKNLSHETWLFAGQWHFIGRVWGWQVPILRDGQRKWVVGIDDRDQKVLRGLTLTDFDVKTLGGR